MKLDCSLETRTSKEGKAYEVVVIKLTPTYEKLDFLDSAEKELLKVSGNNSSTKSPFDM